MTVLELYTRNGGWVSTTVLEVVSLFDGSLGNGTIDELSNIMDIWYRSLMATRFM